MLIRLITLSYVLWTIVGIRINCKPRKHILLGDTSYWPSLPDRFMITWLYAIAAIVFFITNPWVFSVIVELENQVMIGFLIITMIACLTITLAYKNFIYPMSKQSFFFWTVAAVLFLWHHWWYLTWSIERNILFSLLTLFNLVVILRNKPLSTAIGLYLYVFALFSAFLIYVPITREYLMNTAQLSIGSWSEYITAFFLWVLLIFICSKLVILFLLSPVGFQRGYIFKWRLPQSKEIAQELISHVEKNKTYSFLTYLLIIVVAWIVFYIGEAYSMTLQRQLILFWLLWLFIVNFPLSINKPEQW